MAPDQSTDVSLEGSGIRDPAAHDGWLIVPALLFFPVAGVLLFFGMGSFGFLGPDEPRYAQVAREMVRSGDWITPRIAGIPWLEKPVLLYWAEAAVMKVGGVNEWSARFPSGFAAFVLLCSLYLAGRKLHSASFGWIAAIALAANPMVIAFARGATPDMLLTACLGLGLSLFFIGQNDRRSDGRAALASFYACVGMALLAKGLIGVIIPGLVVGAYALLAKHLAFKVRINPLWGLCIIILVASVWYAPILLGHGRIFIDEFIISHHLQRFTSNKFHHPGPFYYYLPVLLGGIYPWTAFMFSSAVQLARSKPDPNKGAWRLRVYCWLWVALPVLFFSFAASKLPGYILPVIPAAALLVALELVDLVDGKGPVASRRACLATPAIVFAMGAAALAYAECRVALPTGTLIVAGMGLLASSVALHLLAWRGRYRQFILGLSTLSAVMVVFGIVWVMPTIAARESMKESSALLLTRLDSREPVVGYFIFPHGLTFYTDARSFYDRRGDPVVCQSPEELIRMLQGRESIVAVAPPRAVPALRTDARFRAEVLFADAEHAFVRIRRKR